MKKPKLRELLEAIKALLKGPYTSRFPYEPHTPPPNFRGKPQFYKDDCIGCGACAEVCPADAIDVTEITDAKPPVRKFELHYDRCIFCGHCELNCTTEKGVRLSQVYDLATFDLAGCVETVEKELVLCEVCGAVVAPKDQLRWIARKVKAKKYANPNLIRISQEELGLVRGLGPRPEIVLERSDVMRILCQKCRREVIVREIWG